MQTLRAQPVLVDVLYNIMTIVTLKGNIRCFYNPLTGLPEYIQMLTSQNIDWAARIYTDAHKSVTQYKHQVRYSSATRCEVIALLFILS